MTKSNKGFISMLIICFLVFISIATVGAHVPEGNIGLTINGQAIELDQPPIMESGRTLVPVRAIFEALGAEVEWYGETQTVVGTMEGITIVLQVGNEAANVNDEVVMMDVPAMTVSGRTLVPARFVAESLGAEVDWDNENRIVKIITNEDYVVIEEDQIEEYIDIFSAIFLEIEESISNYFYLLDGMEERNDEEALEILAFLQYYGGEMQVEAEVLMDIFNSMGKVLPFEKSHKYMDETLTLYSIMITKTQEWAVDLEEFILNADGYQEAYLYQRIEELEKTTMEFVDAIMEFEEKYYTTSEYFVEELETYDLN